MDVKEWFILATSKKIFLSYSTADEKFINETYNILTDNLINYKLFKFNNHQYENPQSWAEIDKNMNEADIYLIFISKISMQSPSVRAEIYAALHKSINSKNFTIKPIIIEDYTNWENEFKPESFPIINSIHRIEEFSQNAQNLAKYIIKNIEQNEWPNYIPNIKLEALLIPIIPINNENAENIEKSFFLILKSNIDLAKVDFIYRTKENYLKNGGLNIGGGISCKFKENITMNSFWYNHLSLLDNTEISKNNCFVYEFKKGLHFVNDNDEIIDLWLKTSTTGGHQINLTKKKEMTIDEIESFAYPDFCKKI